MQGVRDWTDAGVKRSRAAVTLRIGVPTTGGELLEAILGSGQPLLISAGAMWDNTRKQFRPPSDVLLGADVALAELTRRSLEAQGIKLEVPLLEIGGGVR